MTTFDPTLSDINPSIRRSERKRGPRKNKDMEEDKRIVNPKALRRALMKLVEQSPSSPSAPGDAFHSLTENNDNFEAHGQDDSSSKVTAAPNKDTTFPAQGFTPASNLLTSSNKRHNKRKRTSIDAHTLDSISEVNGGESAEIEARTKRRKTSESLTSSTTGITTSDPVPMSPNQSRTEETSTWQEPDMSSHRDIAHDPYDLQHVPYYPHPQFLPLQVMSALANTIHSRRERIFTSLYETDDEHYVPMEIVLPSEARHLGLPWDVCDKFSPRAVHFEDNTEDEMQVWREEQLDWNKAWEDL